MNHTPTPWKPGVFSVMSMAQDGLAGDVTIAVGHSGSTEQDTANMAFIVEAVNAHDALLKAVKTWASEAECYCLDGWEMAGRGPCAYCLGKEAITLAEK